MDTVSLSHPRAITVIQDPIHDSISVTCFEREIIDSEYFQRLHFILQNSTTYIAFPSNKNSRFSHSLGVMHLCGKLFVNSLRNSSPEDLSAFLETAATFVINVSLRARLRDANDLREAWKSTISGHSGFRHRPSLRVGDSDQPVKSLGLDGRFPQKGKNVPARRRFSAGMLVDTLWQAIRICGLAHDIGHLPMSHSLEGAAKKFRKRLVTMFPEINVEENERAIEELYSEIMCSDKYTIVLDEFSYVLTLAYPEQRDREKLQKSFVSYPLHEKRSLYVLLLLFEKGIYKFDGRHEDYRSLVYYLSFLILISSIESEKNFGIDEPRPESVLLDNTAFRFLKLIVSGSIDGDRMDYTVRDGYSCGSHIGRFDVSGVTEHATLFRERTSNDFRIGYFHRALPAIEQFFSQRHQGYKYLIYHRTSSRAEACLQHLVLELVEFCYFDPTDEISEYFAQLGYFSPTADRRHRVFPIYLEAELEHLGPGSCGNQMPYLDDSNLRSFFEWVLIRILRRENTEGAAKLDRFKKIETLLKIVLRRQFQHIYDPYRDVGLRTVVRSALKDSAKSLGIPDSELPRINASFQELFIRSRNHRNDAIKSIRSMIYKKIPTHVQFITNEQEPKIYDHEIARRKGQEVYIVYNGVDSEGYVEVKPIVNVSTSILMMERLFVDEFKARFYFVSDNLKRDEELMGEIDMAMDEAIRFNVLKTLKYLVDGNVGAVENVQS